MNLSQHFTYREMTYSPTAVRCGVDNNPGPDEIKNLIKLCNEILEPVREWVSVPIVISSGYRSPFLNYLIGGSDRSAHMKGNAADFESPGVDNLKLFQKIAQSEIPFDQLILEFYDEKDEQSGWIHIGRSEEPRRQLLKAFRENGRTVYGVL